MLRSRLAPSYRKRWYERLGFYSTKIDQKIIWIHAVSLGEVIAITPVIKKLISHESSSILITTMTPTGSDQVGKTFGDQVQHVYLPYDFPGAIKRFLRWCKPNILIIVETELWPNLLHYTHHKNTPILLVNARLSAKSAAGYARVNIMTQKIFSNVDHISAQTIQDAERFFALGFANEKLSVLGNIKYDLTIPSEVIDAAKKLRDEIGQRPIWLAASTHDGEDEIMLTVFEKLRMKFPDLLLVLVPRHPERFQSVFDLCSEKFITVRRSHQQNLESSTAIFLGDTLGELLIFYALSDITFVGGSFVPTGGHNVIEPASLGKPIITGPHLFNFANVSEQLIKADAMQVVENAEALFETMSQLLADSTLRVEMGEKAKQVAGENRGAVDRVYILIQDMLKNSGLHSE